MQKSSEASVAQSTSGAASRTILFPGEVFAAFESNLAIPTKGQAALTTERSELESVLAERGQPFELAAALAQETAAIFQASLTDSAPQALTLPSLSVSPNAVNLTATVGDPAARRRLLITSLGGTVNWEAKAQVFNGRGWLSVLPASGTATDSTPSALGAEIDFSALGTSPGLFQGSIRVRDITTGYVAVVPVAVVLSTSQSRIVLSQSSVLLTIAGGGRAPPPQTVQIANRGTGTLTWSVGNAEFNPPSANNWLNISPSSGSTGGLATQPSTLTFSLNDANALSLQSGIYQALVPITAAGASNSPQLISVTMQRVPSTTPASPSLLPSGLFFVARQGGAAPDPKPITLTNRGGGTITGTFNASTASGGNWLSVNVTGGSTAAGPFTAQVSANPGTLPTGFYRGTIRATFSSGAPLEVDVVLVVTPLPVFTSRLSPPAPQLNGCTPDVMELIANTIGNGASVPISFPKVLVVTLIDSCGEFVDDAAVVGSAEGSTIPMQALGSGTYSGTWVPQQQSASIPVSFAALHATLPPLNRTFQVSSAIAAEEIQLPVLATDGVVEAAGFTPRRPLAPGGFISLFGARFSNQQAGATQIPLERQLAGVRVRIGNVDAPLHFVSSGQINAQMPVEAQPGSSVSVVVRANGVLTAPQTYLVAPAMPGIFIGSTGPAILNGQNQLITASNPARIGDVLQIFATGLGATDPPVASGAAGPSFSTVTNPVSVEIGGVAAPVVYQGLAPGFVALYQVNVTLPAGTPTGDAVPIVLFQNGIASNSELPATIPIVSQ